MDERMLAGERALAAQIAASAEAMRNQVAAAATAASASIEAALVPLEERIAVLRSPRPHRSGYFYARDDERAAMVAETYWQPPRCIDDLVNRAKARYVTGRFDERGLEFAIEQAVRGFEVREVEFFADGSVRFLDAPRWPVRDAPDAVWENLS
jgi:hypothetical protein